MAMISVSFRRSPGTVSTNARRDEVGIDSLLTNVSLMFESQSTNTDLVRNSRCSDGNEFSSESETFRTRHEVSN